METNLDLADNLIKIGMAVLVGGVIGAEREYQDKAAGFRTIILITLGSTLFTIFSLLLDPENTQTRIAANIVTGIGFLGAGAIVRESGRVAGLTTASTIWLAAALGMGIGAGEIQFVTLATAVTIFVLAVFPRFESRLDKIRESRLYQITVGVDEHEKVENLPALFEQHSLRIVERHQSKTEKSIISSWKIVGSPGNHEKFVQAIMRDKSIRELTY